MKDLKAEVERLMESHCSEAHPKFKECQQQKDILNLFNQMGKELIGEDEANIPGDLRGNIIFERNNLRSTQRELLKEMVGNK